MKEKNLAINVTPKQKSDTKYSDTFIRALFQDKKRAIELCNAVTGSNYAIHTEVMLCNLDHTLLKRYNDLAFAIDDQLLFMVEHQSTISPNLPLRFLSYLTDILYSWFVKVDELYGKKLCQIPTPKLYVLYNGMEPLKEKTLKLSDAFHIKEDEPCLELEVEVIDVNYASGHEVLQRSESLKGYAYLIDQIRIYMGQGLVRDTAISMAIDRCIEQNVLSEFLQEHYLEVAKMLSWEYDQEAEFRIIRREAKEEGIEQGIEEGAEIKAIEIARSLLKSGMTVNEVSKHSNLSVEIVKSLIIKF